MCISIVSFSHPLSSLQCFISIECLLVQLSSHIPLLSSLPSHLPVALLLPPLCSASTPPPVLFSWSIRHNQPLVSGLAWLWLPATCFSSSFSRCLGFVPSASNRLFQVWDRLFLTLPSLGATGLSPSRGRTSWLDKCESICVRVMSTCVLVCQLVCASLFFGAFFFVPLILCNHFETIP